jgi:aminoglycoside phosphotransferase (APT) family kinase protein
MAPSDELLAWVERTVGASGVECERLTGGITSNVHLARIGEQAHVMRSWDAPMPDYARGAVPREAAILSALASTDLPTPRLIAAIDEAPGPALLMTRVPGRVELMPRDRDGWLRQMATMLARIHALDIVAPPFESWLDASQLAAPPDSKRPELWREAIALMATPPPAERTFIHRDYQHFNLLWTDDQLTGVVDWTYAAVGPPSVDVGHCRLNLALLFSAELAEQFHELYEAASGRRVDPWWDVHALLSFTPDWQHFLPLQIDGRASLDVDGLVPRVETVLEAALRRV